MLKSKQMMSLAVISALMLLALVGGALAAGAQGRPTIWASIGEGLVPSSANLYGVAMIDASRAWAVGAELGAGVGYELVWDGSRWGKGLGLAGMRAPLRAVAPLSATNVWFVGEKGQIYHLNGTSALEQPNPVPNSDLFAIQMLGSGEEGWAAGYKTLPNGAPSGESVLLHYRDGVWTEDRSITGMREVRGLHFVQGGGWAVGSDGIWRYSGGGWEKENEPNPCGDNYGPTCFRNYYAARGVNADEAWAVGIRGAACAICVPTLYAAHRSGGTWRRLLPDHPIANEPRGPREYSELRGIYFTSPTDGVAVGSYRAAPSMGTDFRPFLLRYVDRRWQFEASPVELGRPNAVSSADRTHTLVVGDAGLVLMYGYGPRPSSGAGTPSVILTPTPSATGPVPTAVVPESVYKAGGTGNFPFANPFPGLAAFEYTWARTDLPVLEGKVARTWLWGPGSNTPGLLEAYREDPLGRGERLVQYFDKSRMEMNNPFADSNTIGYVTNGLLAIELISGFIQVGERDFNRYRPACIGVAGDSGDPRAPTYAALRGVTNTRLGDHRAPNLTGRRVTATIDAEGRVGNDPAKASVEGGQLVQYESITGHNMPRVFWDFLNSSGEVYQPVFSGGGPSISTQLENDRLSVPWYYAAGLPVSEPYWTRVRISGVPRDVLLQVFERRILTYVPTNPAGFQVEMANIGQHYFDWRYRNAGVCPGERAGTPSVPRLASMTPLVPQTVTVQPATASLRPPGTGTPPPAPTAISTITPVIGP